jgi:hypothetical protein
LHGTFYAATDGVLMAISSSVVEPSLRTSGLGLVTTAVSLSRFGASVAFGGLWLALGPRWPIVVFGLGLAAAVPIAWRSLRVVPS